MQNRWCVVVLCFCVLILRTARADAQILPAEDHAIEAGVMFWKPSPKLILSSSPLVGSGVSSVDLVQQFGITEKTFPDFRVVMGGVHKLRIGRVAFTYNEDTTIQGTFVFRNRTFTIGAPASTDVDWTLWTFGYEYDFVSQEYGFVGFIFDLKRNSIQASINSPLLAAPAATDTTVVVPTIGGIARVYLVPAVALTTEFTGLNIRHIGKLHNTKFYDFDAYGTVSFGRHVGVQGGYRIVIADYEVEGSTAGDLKMNGPYVGAVVRF